MTVKKRNTIALVINILIACFALYALSRYWFSSKEASSLDVGGLIHLRYFTNLSNYFELIMAIVMAVFNVKKIKDENYLIPKKIFLWKFVATISVSVTFLTCVFFLGPIWGFAFSKTIGFLKGYLFMFSGNVFFLHFLCPVLAIVNINFFEKCDFEFTKKEVLLGVLPTAIYSILYATMVVFVGKENGGWEDFYNFTFGGNMKMVPVSFIGMYLATYLISRVEWKINQKNTLKSSED